MEAAGKENGSGGGSGGGVRQQLLARLLSSGTLNSVKAHMRAQLFAELKGRDLNAALAPAPSPSLQQHVLNCLVGCGQGLVEDAGRVLAKAEEGVQARTHFARRQRPAASTTTGRAPNLPACAGQRVPTGAAVQIHLVRVLGRVRHTQAAAARPC